MLHYYFNSFFFFSSRRRHTRWPRDWSSDVCSSDLLKKEGQVYLLDEPSFGLHTKDNERLLEVFQNLVNNGNSVIIVEHNLDFIAASDWIIELGPKGGKEGGQMIFEGTPEEMLNAETLTAKWLREE